MIRSTIVALAAALLLASPTAASASVDVPVSAFGTFLRLDPTDSASLPTRIRLADHGIAPGTLLFMQAIGDFDNGPGGDEFTTQIAIFSSDSVLLDPTLQFRVAGALDCGRRGGTGPTCPSGLTTNLVEDFYVDPDSSVAIVPPGAVYLFVMPAECYFVDNSDPDGDYAIRLTTLGTTDVESSAPAGVALSSPWPNPVANVARLSFRLGSAGAARARVYALDGRTVRTLFDGEAEAGAHDLAWDLRDALGASVSAGVYFVRLDAAGETLRRRVIVTR